MKKTSLYDIIKYPIVTEKSTSCAELGKYIFEISVDANKNQIAKAVENVFNVEVRSVNIINIKGKTKIFKGRKGFRRDRKKAIVSLKSGHILDLSIGV